MKILYLPNSYCQQRQLEKPNFLAYPVILAMEAEWHRKQGDEVIWMPLSADYYENWMWKITAKVYNWKIITEPEGLPFLDLPKPDRIFTHAMDKKYQQNGNFKYLPGTYIQSASGCSHGKCSFCVEKDKPYLVRPVNEVWEEIEECETIGFKEVFDDSATFPTGDWLEEFLDTRPYGNIKISCNMRIDADVDYEFMKQQNFRMLLYGIESANQSTLDKIQKGIKVEDIIPTIKKASDCGLEPHIAVMFGIPGESDKDAINTLRMVHYLLTRGYAKTAQASFYNHAGECSQERHRQYIRKLYDVWKNPRFWLTKLKDIHNVDDLKYLWRAIKKGIQR